MLRSRWIRRVPRSTALPALLLLGATAFAEAQTRRTADPPTTSISFEENHGQTDPAVKFVAKGRASTLFLTADEMILVRHADRGRLLRMRVAGAATRPTIAGKETQPGKVYYTTPGAKGTLTAASTFRRVKYSNIYRGVDLEYYGKDDLLEFDFTVAPHVDPRQIRLSFAGAERVSVGTSGELRVRAGGEDVLLKRPIVYQERKGVRRDVSARYVVSGRHRDVRFAIGSYDPTLPLVIDPAIEYATFLGSSSNERIVSLETNAAGEAYVFGATADRVEFPSPNAGGNDVGRLSPSNTEYCFLSKFDATGGNLRYTVVYLDTAQTFASEPARCDAMTLGPAGLVYTLYQSIDGTFVKMLRTLDDTAQAVTSSTMLVTALEGFLPAPAMKVDADGYIYLLGGCFNRRSQSPNPYPLPSGFRPNPNAGHCTSQDDFYSLGRSESVLLKVASPITGGGPTIAHVVWGTFLGGTDDDETAAIALAIEDRRYAYVGGRTHSLDFPTTQAAAQFTCARTNVSDPCNDGFLMRVDTDPSSSNSLAYSSFLGGIGPDVITSLSVPAPGIVTAAGETGSVDFPTQPAPTNAQQGAVFIERVDFSQGFPHLLISAALPAGIISSGSPPQVRDLSFGDAAVTGVTQSVNFPLVAPLANTPAAVTGAGLVPFVSVFSSTGETIRFSSLLTDLPLRTPRLAVRGADELYVGMTAAVGEGSVGAFQQQLAGGDDIFVTKISGLTSGNHPPIVSDVFAQVVNAESVDGAAVFVSVAASDPDSDPILVTFTAIGPNGQPIQQRQLPNDPGGFYATTLPLPIGASTVQVTVTDDRGASAQSSGTVTVIGAATTSTGTVTIPFTSSSILFNGDQIGDPGFLSPINVTIGNATGAGVTTIHAHSGAFPAPPDTYQFGSPPNIYYLSTTVPGTGPYTVCIDVTGMSFADPGLKMYFHDVNSSTWTDDITISYGGGQLCGRSATPGFYAILTSANPANADVTVAGSGFTPGTPGGDLRNDVVDGLPATETALSLGIGSLAFDRTRQLLYTTTFAGIRRVDLAHGSILDTIAGDGVLGTPVVDPTGSVIGIPVASGVDPKSTHVTNPRQMAADASGNLYFTDYCAVRKISSDFTTITTVAGDGFCHSSDDGTPGQPKLATAARLNLPFGLVVDAQGNLLIAEAGNGRIRRVDTAGHISTVATLVDPRPQTGFFQVERMALAPNGDLYAATDSNLLVRLSAGNDHLITGNDPGEQVSVINVCVLTACAPAPFGGDGGPVRAATFRTMYSVAVESNGDVLIGDLQDYRIRRISAGADHVVTGTADDEVVWTVVGYNPTTLHQGAAFSPDGDDYGLSSPVITAGDVLTDPRGGFFYIAGLREKVRHIGAVAAGAGADLSVSIASPVSDIGVNQTVTYSVTVTNHGPGAATGVSVSMPVAAGLAPTASSPAGFCVVPIGIPIPIGGTIVCDGGALPAGHSVALTITLTPKNVGSLTSTVTATASQADPFPGNNSATIETSVDPSADLAIFPIAPGFGATVQVGVPVTYRMTFANLGPNSTQSAARLHAAIPAGLQFVSATMTGASCDFSSGILTCDIDLFAGGTSLNAIVVLMPLASGPTTITFDASSSDFDSDFSNNSATIALNRAPVAHTGGGQNIGTTTSSATVHLDGRASLDPDGDSLSYAWAEGSRALGTSAQVNALFDIGNHTVTLTVNDGHGGVSMDTALIIVHGPGLEAPANVSAVGTAPGKVTISWDPVPGVTGYRILRDVDPVTVPLPVNPPIFVELGSATVTDVTGTGTTFVDSGLPTLVRQYYAVEAINGSIVSLPTPAKEGEVLVTADPDAEIFGFADYHNHQFSNFGFGGNLISGAPFHWSGSIFDALPTCEGVHGEGGVLDVIGNIKTGPPGALLAAVPVVIPPMIFQVPNSPPLITPAGAITTKGHFTGGTNQHRREAFDGWPRWNSITHQQVYFEWLRRAFDGGMRLMVMHALNNELLCRIAGNINGGAFQNHPCEDVDNIDDQLFGAKNLETFIDQQAGGPGKGWYRIAYSATEARHIINSGKMAVILGIEVDNLFGCSLTGSCTEDFVRTQLDHYYAMGVRHLFPVHAFDNAFGGAAMYDALFDAGNKIIEGQFFQSRDCSAEGYGYKADGVDALVAELQLLSPRTHTFPAECNSRRLTSLGDFLIKEMIKKGMIIDIDHMAEVTADDVLTWAEKYHYAGVASGHSGSTAVLQGTAVSEGAKTSDQLHRIHSLGGVSGVFAGQGDRVRLHNGNGITQHSYGPINDCGSSSKTFAQVYLANVDAFGGENTAAVGIGTDFNGLARMVGPRFGNESCYGDSDQGLQANAVTYPLDIIARPGVTRAGRLAITALPDRIAKNNPFDPFETSQQKAWDYNFDGLAHVGLLPDFIQDLRQDGLTDAQLQPLFRSAEAYVHMWEQAEQTAPVVTPPANITIIQTEIDGARGSASPQLHNFLLGGTAVDAETVTRLAPSIFVRRGQDGTVDDQTLFTIGTTTVTFGFMDAAGHVGTATATVTVTGLVIAHTIALTDTIHVRDEVPMSDGSILQADLSLTDVVHVRDQLQSNGGGVALADLNLVELIHVRDQFPLSGNSLAQAGLTVAETVHIVDSPDIPVVTHTIVGTGGVRYRALDPNGGDTGITAQFTSVLAPGILTANLMPSPPPPPSGFSFVGGVYDVVLISGSVTPPIELCFSGTGFTSANRVLHHETAGGVAQWVDRTTLQTATQVCATVNSLSPFALAVRLAPPATPDGFMFGIGFVDSGSRHHHFLFRASQLKGRNGSNLEYWLTDPRFCRADDDDDRSGRIDGNADAIYGRDHHNPIAHFEATSMTGVTFSDDPSAQPGASITGVPAVDTVRFTGTGKWNGRTGYTFEATASDRGEPGRHRDTFSLVVRDAGGTIVVNVSGAIEEGNIQSLRVP